MEMHQLTSGQSGRGIVPLVTTVLNRKYFRPRSISSLRMSGSPPTQVHWKNGNFRRDVLCFRCSSFAIHSSMESSGLFS